MPQRAVAVGLFLISVWASMAAGSPAVGNPTANLPSPFDRPIWTASAPQWKAGDQYWASEFSLPQVDGIVQCAVEYRGAFVVGGSFHQIGDVPAENIAIWNGSSWSELGGGTDGTVYALLVYQGNLIAGGAFSQVGGRPAPSVARWNGSGWEPLGLGLQEGIEYYDPDYGYIYESPAVRALATYQGALVAGGSFGRSGPFPLASLASWGGSAWLPMTSAIDGPVHALAVSGDTLYAGGQFHSVDFGAAAAVARWDGQHWSGMGAGLTITPGYGRADVRSLLPFYGRLIAGGSFGTYGSMGLAGWNGASWDSIGAPWSYGVQSLAARDDTLYVGGDSGFTTVPADSTAPSWVDGSISALAWYGSNLVALGRLDVRAPGTDSPLAASIAIRRPGGWGGLIPWTDRMRGLSYGPFAGRVAALEVYRDRLLAVGDFQYAGDPPGWASVQSIASWNGAAWERFPEMTGPCSWGFRGPMLSDGDTLYMAGDFYFCGSPSGRVPVMRFDGATWAPLDTLPFYVNAMAIYRGSLYIAGDRFDWPPARSEVYRREGDHWVRVGVAAGYRGTSIRAMLVCAGRLVVGGQFAGMNNQLTGSVAAWDGARWEGIGSITASPYDPETNVTSLAVHRGSLVAAAYQGYRRSVISWNGAAWEQLGSLTALGTQLTSIGGELYLGGQVAWPYTPLDGIARWTGRVWEPLGSGVNGPVRALREWRGSLWVGGEFTRAGSHASFAIARWDGVRATLAVPRVAIASGAPNPFRSVTSLTYRLAAAGDVHISVSDVRGRRIRVLEIAWREAGDHVIAWDGRDASGRPAASGVYYVQVLLLDGTATSRKVLLLR